MLAIYSLILSLGFVIMLPLFLLRREKYAAGFLQRLGQYPEFKHDGRPVTWLHCVSVGETNAARPLVDELLTTFPGNRIIVSTTTKSGQQLAQKIFKGKCDAVIYFPFDWKFSVKKALDVYRPSLVLLMETEIWPRFIREAKASGVKVAIVNGRLSERSFRRYSLINGFVKTVLENVDLALMQHVNDAERITRLGVAKNRVLVTGNIKFDQPVDQVETSLTESLEKRFGIGSGRPLIVAASTHRREEKWIIESLGRIDRPHRLLIAPRHPERFSEVAELISTTNYSFVRRSDEPSDADKHADIILLDSIGELRSIYPLAEIVFVGGSLMPHGGQSILEPAGAGKAIVTGPYTHNFEAVVREFADREAIIQTPTVSHESQNTNLLAETFLELLENNDRRRQLGKSALAVMEANRGASTKTVAKLRGMFGLPKQRIADNG